jgi:plasmid stabilization system protein ParE
MNAQSGADRVDDAIMTAIDLVADRAKSGDVGKVEIPVRRSLTENDRANLREYAELAGVEITIFPDHIDVRASGEYL